MRVRLDGHLWTITRRRHPDRRDRWGHTDRNRRAIYIEPDLPEGKLMEIVIHEILHAYNWAMDEGTVEQFARDCVRIYHRLLKEQQ